MNSIEKLLSAVHDILGLREEIRRLTEHAERLAVIVGEHESRIARLEGRQAARDDFLPDRFFGQPDN